jgi:hypothetical protein
MPRSDRDRHCRPRESRANRSGRASRADRPHPRGCCRADRKDRCRADDGRADRPGGGHDLHQTHRAGTRSRARIAVALDAHDGAYPGGGNAEALRGLGDVIAIGIAARGTLAGGFRETTARARVLARVRPERRRRTGGRRMAINRSVPLARLAERLQCSDQTLSSPSGTGWRGSAAKVGSSMTSET